jgi:hypothetical protein
MAPEANERVASLSRRPTSTEIDGNWRAPKPKQSLASWPVAASTQVPETVALWK